MAATAADLQAWRDRLLESRASGIREVRDADGSTISYRSDREIAAAIAAIERELAAVSGAKRPSVLRFSTSKGI